MRCAKRWTPTLPLVACLLTATVASIDPVADEVAMVGRVVDAETDAPLSAAQVYLRGMDVGALTDDAGSYALALLRSEIPREGVVLVVELIGFRSEERLLSAEDLMADSLSIDFRLQARPLDLESIVVAGSASGTPQRITGVPGRRPAAPHRPVRHRGGDREQYADFQDNRWRSVKDQPLSTFSIDVDRASYSNVRRFLLGEHRLPPVDAVQVEEMINYFSYDYALPDGDHPVELTSELGVAPWNDARRLLRIGLASRTVRTEDLPPGNFVFLLDVSGSMASADKLPLVKRSMRLLVDQLRPVDRVAIVVYAGAAGLVLESTPGDRKDLIVEALDRLEAGGSTAGGAGLRLAYDVARRNFRRDGNNRVILATDGDFNVGESSDAAVVRLIEERRDEGTFLTVLGFGTGNLQFQKMQSLAQHGNGNHAYIDSLGEARKVLIAEMGGTLLTVAQDVKVQVEFNPAHVREYRLVGYENRLLAARDFDDDAKDAGDMGAGHRVTALYEIVPADVAGDGTVPLRYEEESGRRGEHRDELAFVRVRYKPPRGTESRLLEHAVGAERGRPSLDLRFASAVAAFGMLLRGSQEAAHMSVRHVLSLAEEGIGEDADGRRRGFLDLVRAYGVLRDGRRW